MNNIITVQSLAVPVYPERSVVPLSNSEADIGGNSGQTRSNTVYRGEVMEGPVNDKRYRPQFNQEVAPANRLAIDRYQQVANDDQRLGQILDGFI